MWKLAITFLVLAVLAMHLADVDQRKSELQRFLVKKNDALDRIVATYGIASGQCSEYEYADRDTYRLAAALLTVETFATPSLEAWIKYLIVKGAAFVGIAPRNMSIGPGRIRLKTARSALENSTASNLESYRHLPEVRLADQLLATCASVQIAAAIVETIRPQGRHSGNGLDSKSIRETARVYNGQIGEQSSFDAMISADIYFELVYEIFQCYRFRALE